MASGKKTLSGVINYDETLTNPYKIITEYAKEAGKKVGVITSVSVDHATPAAYYAKQPSRTECGYSARRRAVKRSKSAKGCGGKQEFSPTITYY